MLSRRLRFALLLPWLALALRAQTGAPGGGIRTPIVVDSNPALFVVLSALNVAGYDYGLTNPNASPLRAEIRRRLEAEGPLPVYDHLKQYYTGHHLADPQQDLDQYLTLALFLSPPPSMHLTLQLAALPANAADVADFVPLLNQFYRDAGVAALWQSVQPQYETALAEDARLVRQATRSVDIYLRLAQPYDNRTLYIYPDAMLSNLQTSPRDFENNYFVAVNLSIGEQIKRIRHSYLHFALGPTIARFPSAIDQIDPVLKIVANAPALPPAARQNSGVLYTECLVRALEIHLDGGSSLEQQKAVDDNMNQGYVLTEYWYNQLTQFRGDVVDFGEFYPDAAFAIRPDEIVAQNKHRKFSVATTDQSAGSEAVRVATPMETAVERFDDKDIEAARTIATAELSRPGGDKVQAEYLLGKIDTSQDHPQAAAADFTAALAAIAGLDPTSVVPAAQRTRTWCYIYLARLSDAENDRAAAVNYYRQAQAIATSDITKQLAADGIKQPWSPSAGHFNR